ncbi:MBL fold metallo-hydrolase [Neolewinella aurantiaca]|uniref:MBL fold metallo-hydrolase n=1 Tax=Neolewinella aurantiaca TaxID=2602767 RepID=A0A5C7FIS3_9BACT|nr:MBL fold metallo-hydrolase [Neolewinella aurantiaca]TXF89761.1 MBL fold metallo-hydrolase [Neolewinella aurantiaca]
MSVIIHTIDLQFLNEPEAIAAFAIEDSGGYTLVECGPFSTHDNLIAGLKAKGISPGDVHTLLLTHIHFDHAGAAWWWAKRGAKVYVHPKGLKHMINPGRLYGSAARIYGEENMEKLWGRMEEINEYDIAAVTDRNRLTIGGNTWVAHHTPGHASHHIAWQLGKNVFTGDVGGVKIKGGPVVPPLPPPDINISQWRESISRLRSLRAEKFYLTHYGPVDAQSNHLDQLSQRLDSYVAWVGEARKTGQSEEEMTAGFTEFVEADLRTNGVTDEVIGAYRAANPPGMSVAGILRWFTYLEA